MLSWNGAELLDAEGTVYEVDILELNHGNAALVREYPLTIEGEFNGYRYANPGRYNAYLFDADGALVMASNDGRFAAKGELLWCENDATGTVMLYDKNLRPLYHNKMPLPHYTEDGRVLAVCQGDPYSFYRIYSPDGVPEYESGLYDKVLTVIDEVALVVDGGEVKLLNLDESEIVTLCGWHDSLFFHEALTGYFKSENLLDGLVEGYYFMFEDRLTGISFEYCYSPKTGEVHYYEVPDGYAYAKPVLYLYPETETEVRVTFEHPERLTTVYPAYDGGWQVTASPDGTLTDERGRSYYCLYWEEEQMTVSRTDFAEGFCVAGEDSADFLEDALAQLGFTDKEANEFIIYWLPILEQNPYNLIWFELTGSREAANALNISPKPDSLLRMAMHILPLAEAADITPQKLPQFARDGFVAVEWGGVVYE